MHLVFQGKELQLKTQIRIQPHKKLVFFIGVLISFLLVAINGINLIGIHGVNTSVLKLNYIAGIKSDALAMRNHVYRHFFLEKLENMDTQEQVVKDSASSLTSKIENFLKIASSDDRTHLETIKSRLEEYAKAHSKSLNLSKSFLKEDAISNESNEGEPLYQQLLESILTLQDKYSIRNPNELNEKIGSILLKSLLLGAFLSLFFLGLFHRMLIQRIYQILAAIKDIKEGKLGTTLKLKVADEISLVADGISAMSLSLKQKETDLLEYQTRLEEMVDEKTRDIRGILSNIRQGILAVRDGTGTVDEEHSAFLEELLERKDIKGNDIINLCFTQSTLGQDALDQLRNGFAFTVGEDEMAFEFNRDVFPREIQVKRGEKTTILEIDWNPITANGIIRKILVAIRDVTELQQLRLEAERKNAEFALIAEILNIPPEKFHNVIQSSKNLLLANCNLLESVEHLSDSSIDVLFRNMHTFKGLARTYKLSSLTSRIHEVEENYKVMKTGVQIPIPKLLKDIEELQDRVKVIQTLNEEKLGRKAVDSDKILLIDKQQIRDNLSHLQAIDLSNLNGGDRERIKVLRDLFGKMVYNPLQSVLQPQIESLREIAISLGKEPPNVVFQDEGMSINRNLHTLLSNVFSHLLRNSVDHGIEKPEVRLAKGKPAAGTLTFVIQSHFDQLTIVFSDDGRGLNLPKILEKAISKGIPEAQKFPITNFEVAHLILAPGFSTADKVTEISGRGVGMDAVRAYVEEFNGTFEIRIDHPESTEIRPVATQFVISLPGGNFERMDDL
jgi:hypothetical protein